MCLETTAEVGYLPSSTIFSSDTEDVFEHQKLIRTTPPEEADCVGETHSPHPLSGFGIPGTSMIALRKCN